MTESQQPERGWFRGWRDHRRTKRQQHIERALFQHEHAGEYGGMHGSSRPYQHSGPITYGSGFFGGDGGGCGGGDGGGC